MLSGSSTTNTSYSRRSELRAPNKILTRYDEASWDFELRAPDLVFVRTMRAPNITE